MKFFNFFKRGKAPEKNAQAGVSYFLTYGDTIQFTAYNDPKYAYEGYIKNIVAYTCISLIADQAQRLKWRLYRYDSNGDMVDEVATHPVLDLLRRPYPQLTKSGFVNRAVTHKLIYGNYYLQKIYPTISEEIMTVPPILLYPIRPDEISIDDGANHLPRGYRYTPDNGVQQYFPVSMTGQSNIIHGMKIHPTHDYNGLSPLVPAGYSIDTHNAAGKQAFRFLENGAKPSGILSVPADYELGAETIDRLRDDLETKYSGSANAGKPMLLEGGMTWQQVSINPKDGDFIEMKNSAAADIALAFRVPLELLNQDQAKYDNLHAAYERLYHDVVMPLAEEMEDDLNMDLVPLYGDKSIRLSADFAHTKVMQDASVQLMEKLNPLKFLTNNEKRARVGAEPLDGEDELKRAPAAAFQGAEENALAALGYAMGELLDGGI